MGITQLVGSFITPPIMERYGRKVAHFAATVPNLIGWFIITIATNFEVRANKKRLKEVPNERKIKLLIVIT